MIKESPQYKLYNWKLDKKTLFDIKTMTGRETLGLCSVHIAQLMIRLAISTLPFTLLLFYKLHDILQRVTKIQKVHIPCHD